jgi:hypothetical protein
MKGMLYPIILAALTTPAFAIDSTGNANFAMVRGVVTDRQRPVGNIRVMAYGDTDVRETKTDAEGRYFFMTLLPGIYTIYTQPSVLTHVTSESRACPQTLMELSAGQLYLANIDLQPSSCN